MLATVAASHGLYHRTFYRPDYFVDEFLRRRRPSRAYAKTGYILQPCSQIITYCFRLSFQARVENMIACPEYG
jgi:hypothetical protein